MEKKAKKLVLAAIFASAFATSAIVPTSLLAQGNPRNHRFVRAIPNNPSIYQWRGSNAYAMSPQSTLPRDPAFGKGNADNDTFNLPSESDFR